MTIKELKLKHWKQSWVVTITRQKFFYFLFQVGSATLHRDDQDRPVLLISQPGGSYLRLRVPAGRPTAAAVFEEEERNGEHDDEAFKMVRNFEVRKSLLS